MADRFVLAIDQGTSATKCLLLDVDARVVARSAAPLTASFPHPGWVEQDPEQLWESVVAAVATCLADRDPASVVAVGISNQRESLVLWDPATGRVAGPLVGWQDQRTAADCDRLLAGGAGDLVRRRSGLPLDPMFSALKARWLLDHHPTRPGSRWALGTVDSYLLSRLDARTAPHGHQHLVEAGNASRTQLMDVERLSWDPTLLELFGIDDHTLPRIVASTGPFVEAHGLPGLSNGAPVTAVLGDSHAALFGHGVRTPGTFKATYGTGSSVMGLLPAGAGHPGATSLDHGLCVTVAWDIAGPAWAVEGNIRSTGATLAWLAGVTGSTPAALAALARTVHDPGVHLVPAFAGLGAPWWNRRSTATISGLTFDTGLAELARAALESTAFQVADVVDAARRSGLPVDTLLADGGASGNDDLMQFQADILGVPVIRPAAAESSALGAAHLAGLAAGVWTERDLQERTVPHQVFAPQMPERVRHDRLGRWRQAVDAVLEAAP